MPDLSVTIELGQLVHEPCSLSLTIPFSNPLIQMHKNRQNKSNKYISNEEITT